MGSRWENHGRGYTGGPRTVLLFLSPSFFAFAYCTARHEFPKRAASVGRPNVCDRGVKVAGMPFSPCLSPSQLVCLVAPHPVCLQAQPDLPHSFYLSISRLILPPSDVVLSTSSVFALGYIGWVYGGFKPATYII